MSGANKAEKLREYFNHMPTLEGKIRAIVRYAGVIGTNTSTTPEEEDAFYQIALDTFLPIDNKAVPQDGEKRIDTEKSMEAFSILGKLRGEYANKQGMDATNWQAFFHKNNREAGLSDANIDSKGMLHGVAYSSGSIRLASSKQLMETILMDERKQQFNRQIQNEKHLLDLDYLDLNEVDANKDFDLQDHPVDVEIYIRNMINAKTSDKLNDLGRKADAYQQPGPNEIGNLGMTDRERLTAINVAGAIHKAQTPMPWLTADEDKSRRIGLFVEDIPCLIEDKETLLHKMQQITNVVNRMEAKLSGIGDSSYYKEMLNSMKAVRTQATAFGDRAADSMTAEEMQNYQNLMLEVQKKSAAYMDARAKTASTKKGNRRVDAAFLALSICQPEAAEGIKDTINTYRRAEKKPQFLNITDVAEEYGIALDEPKLYNNFINNEKMAKSPAAETMNTALCAKTEAKYNDNVDRVFGGTKEEINRRLAEIAELGKLAGLKNQAAINRAGANILGYYYHKHPEARGRRIDELGADFYANAYNEYKQFLTDNAIYRKEADGSLKLLDTAKVNQSLANMAEYHHDWMNEISSITFPDLTDPKIRRDYMERSFQVYQNQINASQNEENLVKFPEYYEAFPAEADGHKAKSNAAGVAGYITSYAEKLDDPTELLQVRLASKLMLDKYKEDYVGKTPAQLAGGPKYMQFIADYGTFLSATVPFTGTIQPEEKQEYLAFLEGSKPMPERLKNYLAARKDMMKEQTDDAAKDQGVYEDGIVNKYKEWKKKKEQVVAVRVNDLLKKGLGDKPEARKRSNSIDLTKDPTKKDKGFGLKK